MTTDVELNFAEQLFDDVINFRNKMDEDFSANSSETDKNTEMSPFLIKHWLNFAVYYEKAAAVFIGEWLKSTNEDDAFVYFAHQIEDEANHYRWLKKHLSEYVVSVDDFVPPPEWRFLMEEYYPKLPTLIHRLAAHNISAETGALGFAETMFHRMPEKIKKTMEQVIKDERYHVSFGMKLLNKYCITENQKDLAKSAAFESLQYMKKARSAFFNI